MCADDVSSAISLWLLARGPPRDEESSRSFVKRRAEMNALHDDNDNDNVSFLPGTQLADSRPGFHHSPGPEESSGEARRSPTDQEHVSEKPLAARHAADASRWRRADRRGRGQGG